MTLIKEHSITLSINFPKNIPSSQAYPKQVNSKMEVFYNPSMASNRNLSILLLNTIAKNNLKIADPLAGSGIRTLRFLKELKKNKIKQICVNDFKKFFPEKFKEEVIRNKLSWTKLTGMGKKKAVQDAVLKVSNEEASQFLLHETGFDYIDIDPFGSPNPFLAAAAARISREGILAVTATDTAALTGTYPKVTKRKYWAEALHNYLMHEMGLRVLIRKIQLQGIQFDKAIIPLLSYHKEHYFRTYLQAAKGKEKCDEIIRQHQYFLFCSSCLHFHCSLFNREKCPCGQQFQFAGPLWVGELTNSKLIQKMAKNNHFPEEQSFLYLLAKEAAIPQVGFYDLHEIAKRMKKDPPPMEIVLRKVSAVRTHFSGTGIKTMASLEEIEKLF